MDWPLKRSTNQMQRKEKGRPHPRQHADNDPSTADGTTANAATEEAGATDTTVADDTTAAKKQKTKDFKST